MIMIMSSHVALTLDYFAGSPDKSKIYHIETYLCELLRDPQLGKPIMYFLHPKFIKYCDRTNGILVWFEIMMWDVAKY